MRTAVIGAGRMGRRHMKVVQDMGLRIVGICDLNLQALSLATQELDIRPNLYFTDDKYMLEDVRPEFVIVATTAPSIAVSLA